MTDACRTTGQLMYEATNYRTGPSWAPSNLGIVRRILHEKPHLGPKPRLPVANVVDYYEIISIREAQITNR